jgi:hypothetical protein
MAKKPKYDNDDFEMFYYPPEDGKRYVAAIASVKDPCTFQHFAESDGEDQAKNICIARSNSDKRQCIIFDRQAHDVIFRHG